MKRYEDLRHADYFDESVKTKLRQPGKEFTLRRDDADRWRFYPRNYDKHKIVESRNNQHVWRSNNPFGTQPLQLRIEALMSARVYDVTDNQCLVDFSKDMDFTNRSTADHVQLDFRIDEDLSEFTPFNCVMTVKNNGQKDGKGAWAKVEIPLDPPFDLSQHQALGLWVHGDGKGEVLNVQLRSPEHLIGGYGERYIIVDFTGWRYFELIEMESERYSNYRWPYGSPYSIYREKLVFDCVTSVNLWVNDIPLNEEVQCRIGPIKALPLVNRTIENPAITVGGRKIVFPVELISGQYLEFYSHEDCMQYGANGELIAEIKPLGEIPVIDKGQNEMIFTCNGKTDVNARARVTIVTESEPL